MGQVLVLPVAGMDCGACERRLATVLARLDGVGRVEADHVRGEVRMWVDTGRVSPEAVRSRAVERIEQSDFTVGEERTP